MRRLLKNAKIIDPSSSFHEKKVDILINKGKIEKIGKNINSPKAKVFTANNLHVSPTFFDIGTQICDPGFEHRENLNTVSEAALAGGFTGIACFPNTQPTVHSKSQVQYILTQTQNQIVDFYPIGAVSENCKGTDITEMYDMQNAGAIAFSDGCQSIDDGGMMLRALQYVKPFDGLIINHPSDKTTSQNGLMHEGITSTSLGMKGIPSLAEELMIIRDIYLAEYTDSRVHIHNISTEKGVRLIKEAKKKKLKISASVASLNLIFNDQDLGQFDSNLKVLPPLRTNKDIKALIKGLKDGTIDCITTNHTPWHVEAKDLEFSYAEFGVIGLETTFVSLLNAGLDLSTIIQKLSIDNRHLFKIAIPSIEVDNISSLVLYNPSLAYTFESFHIKSKSHNTPFLNYNMKGQVLGVVHKNKSTLN